MANFKAVVRTARADGFYQVYICVTHHRSVGYIKTDKMITKNELTKSGEIKDPFVLQYCTKRILEYNDYDTGLSASFEKLCRLILLLVLTR